MDCKIRNIIQCEDTIVLSEDETETPLPIKKKQINRNSKKCERKVALGTVGKNTEKLVITQKVQVKKQNIKCVINLNTNVYENKINKCKVNQQKPESIVPKAKCNIGSFTERILPTCGRKTCKSVLNIKKEPRVKREIKGKIKRKISSRSKKNRKKEACRCKKSKNSKRKHHSATKTYNHTTLPKDGNLNETLSLSSISLLPFKTSEVSYEDISLDSFSNCSEIDIDTLIKRAKERDTQNSFIGQRLHCSTPNDIIEISSDDEVLVIDEKSTKNTSIHSIATLVLEPQLHKSAYSPEISHVAVESSIFSKQFQEKYSNKYCENIQTKKTKYGVVNHQKIGTSNFLFSDVKNTQPYYYYDDNVNNNLKDVKNENIANIKSFKSESDNALQTKSLSN